MALGVMTSVVALTAPTHAGAGQPLDSAGPSTEVEAEPFVSPCPIEDDAVVSPEAEGTTATGECVPSRRIRLVDSAVWVFTVVVFVAVVVAVLRGPARREPDADTVRSAEPGDADG